MPTKIDSRRSILDAGQRAIARKGWAAVGLTEILTAAGVPKGSFYYYFGSKETFGEAMLAEYFIEYLADMDRLFAQPGFSAAERLMRYWEGWRATQSMDDCQGKCLAVKLGAEVVDLSETLRLALKNGTAAITGRIETIIEAGLKDGSLSIDIPVPVAAQTLYNLWLGASVMAKIQRTPAPMDNALTLTGQMLHQ
ncbi:TetR/AcrR family transcriptional regulator [Arthrobacter bambusae]|uniref:TetR/AcrR family transcriptional regulator n=1 Tax=Arthrobacter TaxID=1663 RepID=UPI001F510C65|nr:MULTISPECIES: TetR/AcrR family transcriptional regulator [Arthrobacter]MCI0141680.1 TetR/AcrR family transcriptional regulator [Arthrobacter bambusae]UYY83175.1 TetR/AcrR family transcriptional regulator [Arthrobacter sp. YA7-1]